MGPSGNLPTYGRLLTGVVSNLGLGNGGNRPQRSFIRKADGQVNTSARNMIRTRFGLEKRQSDLTPELFTYFTNMYVNNWSINAQSASLLTGSFDFMGSMSGMQEAGVGGDDNSYFTGTDDAYTAAGAFNGFNAVSHVGDVILRPHATMVGRNLNGLDNPAYLQGLDLIFCADIIDYG